MGIEILIINPRRSGDSLGFNGNYSIRNQISALLLASWNHLTNFCGGGGGGWFIEAGIKS